MTGKQKAMVVERLKDKRAHNHEIIERAGYKAKSVHTKSQIYLENMKKPEIAKKLNDVADEMEDTLITDVRKYRESKKLGERQFANDTARWIHDKAKGKATQTVNTTNTNVNLDLTLSDVVKGTS